MYVWALVISKFADLNLSTRVHICDEQQNVPHQYNRMCFLNFGPKYIIMHKKHSSEEGETSTCVRDWNPSQISIFLPQKPKINVIANVFFSNFLYNLLYVSPNFPCNKWVTKIFTTIFKVFELYENCIILNQFTYN